MTSTSSAPGISGPPATALAPLLDYDELAGILGLSRRQVGRLVKRGELPVVRLGRAVRFAPSDVLAYVESRRGVVTRT